MREDIKERIDLIQKGKVPEGYQKTKLGIIPEDWNIVQIKDILEKVEKPVRIDKEQEYIQIGIRSHGKGIFYKEPIIGKELGNKRVFWIEPDCFIVNIVFAWEQAITKTTINELGYIASHRFPMYRPINGRVTIDYLIQYFLTQAGKEVMETASPGGAGRNRTLGQERFMKSKIICPQINEQDKIAQILKSVNQNILLIEKEIEEKNNKKKFLMQNLLTGKKRISGFGSKWKNAILGDYIIESKIVAIPDMEKRLTVKLGVKGVEKRIIKTVEKEDATTQYVRRKGQLIYGKQNLHKGAIAIIPEELDGFQSSSDLPAFDVKEGMDAQWLFYFLSRKHFYEYLENYTTGTGSKRIQVNNFYRIKVNMPSDIQEQKAIAKIFLLADTEIELLENKLRLVRQEKKAIMQLLLTGIVRVSDY